MRFPFVRWAAAVLLALTGGCGSSTTPTISDLTSVTQFFSGSLAPGTSSGVFTFSVTLAGTTNVMLGSVTSAATGEPSSATLTLNLGTVSGTACAPTTTKTVAAALAAQITAVLTAGTYCVTVADTGSLVEISNFTVRTVSTTGTPPLAVARFDLFPSTLARNGSVTKTFTAVREGTASLTLTTVASDTVLAIEVGLGLWDGSACRLNTTVVTTGGADPQIVTSVDAGTYCVLLKDIGQLSGQVPISGTITHQ
jgi:hypothetical protein